ncbi:unnamed protein product, partial [Polarella glacialis]
MEGDFRDSEGDFRDSEGYSIVGGRCSLCNEPDFLPSKCCFCQALFCQLHADPQEHDCQKVPDKLGMQATVCSSCQETVRWESPASTEDEALERHRQQCKGSPAAKDLCPAPRCHTELGLLNVVTCGVCLQRVCTTHRFEDSHPCG